MPLSVRQERGAIIAEGWASVPAKLHDYALVSVGLFLWGAPNNFHFNFRARVNRDLMREYEKRQLERRERMHSTERTGIFGPKRGQVENHQKSVSPKEAINLREASGDDDRELHKPN